MEDDLTDEIPEYTWIERFKYTRRRKWFCKKKFLFWMVPYVATNRDIFVDYLWRDIQVYNKKQQYLKK